MDDKEFMMFTVAILNEEVDEVVNILRNGVNINDDPNREDGFFVLHLAISKNNPGILRLLIEGRADIEKKDSYGRTPFLFSVCENAFECTKVLVDCGANIHATDYIGMNALHVSSSGCLPTDKLKYLIDIGVDVNQQEYHFCLTPLHLSRKQETADFLMENGADYTIPDHRGNDGLYRYPKNVRNFLIEKHSFPPLHPDEDM